jgi:hypothetical protein
VAKPMAGGGWSSGGPLLIWAGVAVIGLFTVLAVAAGGHADSLVFGRAGTAIFAVATAVLAVVAAFTAWRGVSGTRSVVLAGGQFLGAALVLVMMIGFFAGDGTTVSSVAPLLLSCVLAEAMIGVGVLHSARRSSSATRGR